jgi:hypothetical protein
MRQSFAATHSSTGSGVVRRSISPLMWRRLLIGSDGSIDDLQATLQLTMGGTDEYLNRS